MPCPCRVVGESGCLERISRTQTRRDAQQQPEPGNLPRLRLVRRRVELISICFAHHIAPPGESGNRQPLAADGWQPATNDIIYFTFRIAPKQAGANLKFLAERRHALRSRAEVSTGRSASYRRESCGTWEPGSRAMRAGRPLFQPSGPRLPQTDEALRIRQVDGRPLITYKGPKIDRQTKTRREIELPLPARRRRPPSNSPSCCWPWASFRWLRSANTGGRSAARLARARGRGGAGRRGRLGHFVELEISANEASLDAARQALAALAASLELTDSERRSYSGAVAGPPLSARRGNGAAGVRPLSSELPRGRERRPARNRWRSPPGDGPACGWERESRFPARRICS